MKSSLSVLASLLAAVCVLGSAGHATAQEFPNKPIRIVVANSPGSIADLAARTLGQEMSKTLGQPIIVEAKPGANQLIGLDFVHKQPADGYTLILTYITALAALPTQVKSLNFDPLKDFPPITTVFRIRVYLTTPRKQPWSNFEQFAAYAKANPGKLNFGSNNVPVRLIFESMFGQLGVNLVHVPFTGAGPLIQALATDQIQIVLTNEQYLNTFKEQIQPIAITGTVRDPKYPNLPTLTELGFPQMRDADYMLNIRAGTPQPIVDRLYNAAVQALRTPEVRAAYTKMQFEPVGNSTQDAAKAFADEAASYTAVAKKLGLQPQ